MLVLTRKPQEKIIIGDNIEIMLISIKRDQVRIGIECPKDIRIVREELLRQQEKAE